MVRALLYSFVACAAAGATTSVEPDTDRPGADLQVSSVATVDACRRACDNLPRCRAYTWVGAGQCFLKSLVPPAVQGRNGRTSGVKLTVEPGIDRPSKKAVRTVTAHTAASCAVFCAEDTRCRSFTLTGHTCT